MENISWEAQNYLPCFQYGCPEIFSNRMNQVVGAYAIAVFDKERPKEIVVAKLGSP